MASPSLKESSTTERVFRAIVAFRQEHDYSPSYRDLMALTGLRSSSSIDYHLRKLRAAGLIAREDGQARTIVVTYFLAERVSGGGG